MLVVTVAAGPKLAEVTADRLPAAALAGAFDSAFFFLKTHVIAGVLLMLMARERKPSGKLQR
jgi:hypothetical protein